MATDGLRHRPVSSVRLRTGGRWGGLPSDRPHFEEHSVNVSKKIAPPRYPAGVRRSPRMDIPLLRRAWTIEHRIASVRFRKIKKSARNTCSLYSFYVLIRSDKKMGMREQGVRGPGAPRSRVLPWRLCAAGCHGSMWESGPPFRCLSERQAPRRPHEPSVSPRGTPGPSVSRKTADARLGALSSWAPGGRPSPTGKPVGGSRARP